MKFILLKNILIGSYFFINSIASATLISSYDFNGDYSDSLNQGADLYGKGEIVNGRYTFSQHQILIADMYSLFAPEDSYAIEMKFHTSSGFSGNNGVIDWGDIHLGEGLYILDNKLVMNSYDTPFDTTVPSNEDFTLGFEFDSLTNTISYYMDGAFIGSWVDDENLANLEMRAIRFFDGHINFGIERGFVGSLDFIRFHHDASTFGQLPQINSVPEPTTLAILGLGMLGFVSRRFTK